MKSTVVPILKTVYARFKDDDVPSLAAQLTYYLILAFFPFLGFLLTAVNFPPLNKYDWLGELTAVLPADTGKTVRDTVAEALTNKNGTLLSIGAVTSLWAASKGVEAIIKALNKAYDTAETRPLWKLKAISLLYTLALAFVIIVSFLLLVFGRLLARAVYDRLPLAPSAFDWLWGVVQVALPLAVMLLVYSFLFVHAPNRRLRVKEVVPGAIFVTLGWIALSLLFSLYVNQFAHYDDTYGSLGGIVVLLLWLYYSSMLIMVGGEINAARSLGAIVREDAAPGEDRALRG